MEIINPSICNPNIKIFSSSKPESEKKKTIIISLKLLELSTKKKIFSLSKNTYLGETYLPTPPTELSNDVKNI